MARLGSFSLRASACLAARRDTGAHCRIAVPGLDGTICASEHLPDPPAPHRRGAPGDSFVLDEEPARTTTNEDEKGS